MSSQEAESFLEVYLAEAEPSLDLLRLELQHEGGPRSALVLDYSPEGLLKLWEFFQVTMRTEQVSPEELKGIPEWMLDRTMTERFTSDTNRRIIWIGLYFATMLRKAFPKLRWAIGKQEEYRNQPVLKPFSKWGELAPHELVQNIAWRALRNGPNPAALIEMYEKWSSKAPR